MGIKIQNNNGIFAKSDYHYWGLYSICFWTRFETIVSIGIKNDDQEVLIELNQSDFITKTNEWNHVFLKIDSDFIDFYINGELQKTKVLDASFSQLNKFFIYNGDIAEFAIWNDALDSDKIELLNQKITPLYIAMDKLLCYLPLYSGDMVLDTIDLFEYEKPNNIETIDHPLVSITQSFVYLSSISTDVAKYTPKNRTIFF